MTISDHTVPGIRSSRHSGLNSSSNVLFLQSDCRFEWGIVDHGFTDFRMSVANEC